MKITQSASYLLGIIATSLILIWLGIFKYTPTEAAAIKPLIENHFLMSWIYSLLSDQAVSSIVGTVEIITGVALLIGLKKPLIGYYSGLAACVIFLVTFSFMFTTPGTFKVVDGVFITSYFLLKDLAYLAISLGIVAHNRPACHYRKKTAA